MNPDPLHYRRLFFFVDAPAYVVSDYTGHDGKNKRYEQLRHGNHLLYLGAGLGAAAACKV